MPPYDKMYCLLFNAISDALPLILTSPLQAWQHLKQAQQKTEELFLAEDNAHPDSLV